MNLNKRNLLLSCFLSLLLNGFFIQIYRPPVQQGNPMTLSQVEQLKEGMTLKQVEHLLGSNVLSKASDPDSVEYIDYYDSGRGQATIRKLILWFEAGKLKKYEMHGKFE